MGFVTGDVKLRGAAGGTPEDTSTIKSNTDDRLFCCAALTESTERMNNAAAGNCCRYSDIDDAIALAISVLDIASVGTRHFLAFPGGCDGPLFLV